MTIEIQNLTKQLEELEERRQFALRESGVGIWEWDVVSNKLVWDQNMLDIYDMCNEDFCGLYDDWASRVHPDDIARCEKSLSACIADVTNKTKYYYRFRVKRSGVWRYVVGVDTCLRDSENNLLKVVGINMLEPESY